MRPGPQERPPPLRSPVPRPRIIARRLLGLATRAALAMFLGATISITIAIWAANTDRGRPIWIRTPATGSEDAMAWQAQVNGFRFVTTYRVSRVRPRPSLFEPQIWPQIPDLGSAPIPPSVLALLPDRDTREAAATFVGYESSATTLAFHSAGWPRPCMAWREPAQVKPPVSLEGCLFILRVGPSIGIPPHLLWRNLAVDAVLLGVPTLLCMLAVPPLRAWRRRRRGLCPICAYDLKHNLPAGCPECGWNRNSVEPAPAP